jgi:hypothetical protein
MALESMRARDTYVNNQLGGNRTANKTVAELVRAQKRLRILTNSGYLIKNG